MSRGRPIGVGSDGGLRYEGEDLGGGLPFNAPAPGPAGVSRTSSAPSRASSSRDAVRVNASAAHAAARASAAARGTAGTRSTAAARSTATRNRERRGGSRIIVACLAVTLILGAIAMGAGVSEPTTGHTVKTGSAVATLTPVPASKPKAAAKPKPAAKPKAAAKRKPAARPAPAKVASAAKAKPTAKPKPKPAAKPAGRPWYYYTFYEPVNEAFSTCPECSSRIGVWPADEVTQCPDCGAQPGRWWVDTVRTGYERLTVKRCANNGCPWMETSATHCDGCGNRYTSATQLADRVESEPSD